MNSYGDPGKSSGGLAAGYDVLSNSVGPETFGNLTAEDDGEGLKYDRNNTVGRYYVGSVNMPYESAVDRLKAFRDSVNNAMVGYHPLMMNSNSFAFEAPTALGLPRPNPEDYPHAPGASRTIRRMR